MNGRAAIRSALLTLAVLAGDGMAGDADYRAIAGGTLRSVLPADGVASPATVAPYLLRTRLVTNAEFSAFVQHTPEWQRGQVPALLAAPSYLSGWSGATDFKPLAADAPVVHVGWFAAQAYCASEGGRLPRWYEWEFAAAADDHRADARDDPAWLAHILGWYADAGKQPPHSVATGQANYYGIHDLHGLVWEWVEDYSGLFVNADSRASGDQKLLDYCGGAALSLADRRNYAVLMRLALLSAMDARQDGANLGFRCVREPAPHDQGTRP
ncbi:formylglycine-generating enzyme family protein [Rugamonas sp. A1-17]|nr:formylglycine-generating enzyme family protein [Rugamonas sp. A1-17]